MLHPFIQRRTTITERPGERGVTIALVALAIFSIIAMAGLSIDIGTLYQASAEAQRAADVAALSAARVLSLSGITGDPNNSSNQWINACNAATEVAQGVAARNTIGGSAPSGVSVTFPNGGNNCSATSGGFGVNPVVSVQVTQASLPTYFARIWGRSGTSVSATAIAEAFNSSNSGAYSATGNVVPVQPRCVKPIIVPNIDPENGTCSGGTCSTLLSLGTGAITNPGIITSTGVGVIGEQFFLVPDCTQTPGGSCNPPALYPPKVVQADYLPYLPGLTSGTPIAVPSCAAAGYQAAIAGCDETTKYECGVQSASTPTQLNLSENPFGANGDAATAMQCLTNWNSGTGANGADSLETSVFPYAIRTGSGNPLGVSGVVTTSNSIITIPIFDNSASLGAGTNPSVNIVGFLQVFINSFDGNGNPYVTVLNIAGCGAGVSESTQPLYGSSPVPIRLITAP